MLQLQGAAHGARAAQVSGGVAEAGAVVWSCGPEVLGTASVTPPLTAKALTIRSDRVRARLRTDVPTNEIELFRT